MDGQSGEIGAKYVRAATTSQTGRVIDSVTTQPQLTMAHIARDSLQSFKCAQFTIQVSRMLQPNFTYIIVLYRAFIGV